MTAVLPRYRQGPANFQVSTLIFGGQFVVNTTVTAGTTDLTVMPATNGDTVRSAAVLGVAGNDANVIASQTGAPNTYGQPLIDISVLPDYVDVYYGGVDIPVWYSAACTPGTLLVISGTNGQVGPAPVSASWALTTPPLIVGRCTNPGGVAAGQLTQAIGGIGSASYYLGYARIF
jgi:hypothetical protein